MKKGLKIAVPNPDRKRALFVVDVQEGFLNDRNRWIIPNIQKVIQQGDYCLVVEAVFHAAPGSLWAKQVQWTFPLQPTISEIKKILPQNTFTITKTTKSAFKGDKDLPAALHAAGTEEVHIVGVDVNDCVFATAQESFDLGFFTYVLEECAESSESAEIRDCALKILRHLRMTNHSPIITSKKIL